MYGRFKRGFGATGNAGLLMTSDTQGPRLPGVLTPEQIDQYSLGLRALYMRFFAALAVRSDARLFRHAFVLFRPIGSS